MSDVLLVIDVQEKYISRYDAALVDRISERILRAEREKTPVIYVLNAGRSADSEVSPLAKGLVIVEGNKIVKRRQSSFSSEEFVLEMERYRNGFIELTGVDGCCCVAATALDGARRGYRMVLNMACVGTIDEKRYARRLEEMRAAGVTIDGNCRSGS